MPPLVRSEPLRGKGYLSGHAQLKLVIRNLEESQQFSDEDPDIRFVDQRIRQLQCTTSDGNIAISQTVKNGIAMPLNSVCVDRDDLVECIQSHISKNQGNQSLGVIWLLSYLMLLSLLLKNLPSMLIAMTLRPLSASISNTVKTVSYKMEFPTFLVESVLVAT